MILLPYSTALTLSRPPVITYAMASICVLVFLAQSGSGITESLMYYPDSWNPAKMVTSSVAHAGWGHLIGNLVFFMAFAPALEFLIGGKLRYLWFMLLITLTVGISYSISVAIGTDSALPTLGFSGVVMGIIGLSAFLMPQARIRVFWWFYIGWKTFYVPVWILAACFIGLDILTMLMVSDYGGVNVVAHVAGGLAGYLYGYLRLKSRREETREELLQEIEAMELERKFGKTRSETFRAKSDIEERQLNRQQQREHDKFMGRLYQMVKTHRNSEAVLTFLARYGTETPVNELEVLFEPIKDWGPSRMALCLGRLIIEKLDREKRYGRALFMIEKCQSISPQFVLPDISRTLFYAQMALDTGKPEVTQNLMKNPKKRYGSMLNPDQCNHLLQKAMAG
jgi:membrane associated rhomboid family serine protease